MTLLTITSNDWQGLAITFGALIGGVVIVCKYLR